MTEGISNIKEITSQNMQKYVKSFIDIVLKIIFSSVAIDI